MKPALPPSRPLGMLSRPASFPFFEGFQLSLYLCPGLVSSLYCRLASSSMFCYRHMANLVLRGPISRTRCELVRFLAWEECLPDYKSIWCTEHCLPLSLITPHRCLSIPIVWARFCVSVAYNHDKVARLPVDGSSKAGGKSLPLLPPQPHWLVRILEWLWCFGT